MPNEAKESYTLYQYRSTPFRRTVRYYQTDKAGKIVYKDGQAVERKKPYQFVFVPGKHVKLTEEEVAFLKTEIESGLLVPTVLDERGRQRDPNQIPQELVDAESTIAKLEKRLDELGEENAKLREQLKPAEDDKKDAPNNDTTADADKG